MTDRDPVSLQELAERTLLKVGEEPYLEGSPVAQFLLWVLQNRHRARMMPVPEEDLDELEAEAVALLKSRAFVIEMMLSPDLHQMWGDKETKLDPAYLKRLAKMQPMDLAAELVENLWSNRRNPLPQD